MVVVEDFVIVQLELGQTRGLLVIHLGLLRQLSFHLGQARTLGSIHAFAHLALQVLESLAESGNTTLIFLFLLVGDLTLGYKKKSMLEMNTLD